MTVFDYLSQYGLLRSCLNSDRNSLEALEASVADVRVPEIREEQGKTLSAEEAPYLRTFETIDRLREKIARQEDLLWRLKGEMLQLMASLPPREYELVMLRYIRCLKWEEVFSLMNASKATVLRWHKEILARLSLPEHYIDLNLCLFSDFPNETK